MGFSDQPRLAEATTLAVGTATIAYAGYRMIATKSSGLLPLSPQTESNISRGDDASRAFVFGLGYTGSRFAKQLKLRGWHVSGTVRSVGSATKFRQLGINAFPFDSNEVPSENELQPLLNELAMATHILVTAAPTSAGDPILTCKAIASVLLKNVDVTTWVGYLSTVGVYGNRDGQEIDENSEVKPSSERGRRRVLAEKAWRNTDLPVCIFRLPGIYGPWRGPIEKVRSGTARRVVKEGQIFSRMHVDDIVRLLLSSAAHPRNGAIYNAVDDEPAAGHVVITYACSIMNVKPPPLVKFEDAELSAMARSFYSECRYIRNSLIKREFQFDLLYPTYREGYKAQLEQEATEESVVSIASKRLSQILRGIQKLWTWPTSAIPIHVVLFDNGSVRAESTIKLREVANTLSADSRCVATEVHAVSARWSTRVDATDLGGRPAELLIDCLRRIGRDTNGKCEVILLPFFIGPSDTVTSFASSQARVAISESPNMEVKLAPPLFCPCPYLMKMAPPEIRRLGLDNRLARAVSDQIRKTMQSAATTRPHVLLCDHGTPTKSVNAARQAVSEHLRILLGAEATNVTACSMERRKGIEYDFNAPLLEDALTEAHPEADGFIVALLFLGPGKHAGPGGDIATIIKSSSPSRGLPVHVTNVIGRDPLIIDILVDRVRQSVLV